MAEGLKTLQAVVGAHAAGAHAAKGQFLLADVHDHVVDADAARGGAPEYRVFFAPVATEVIRGERPGPRVDVGDGLGKVPIAANRQQGAENFLVENLAVLGGVDDQRRRNFVRAALLRKILAARIDRQRLAAFRFKIGQIAVQALVVALVDDRGVLRIVQQRGVHLGGYTLQGVDHLRQALLGDHQVIGRQTDLPRVQGFAQHDALRGKFEIDIAREDHRRLAAQFQGHGHQVARGRGHDVAGDAGGAGEQQVVKGQPRKGLAHFGTAGENGDFFFVPGLGDHGGHQLGRGRGEFRGLDHDPIARRQDPRQRAEGQIHREIPRRNHAHNAQGLVFDARASAQQVQGEHRRALLWAHPFVQVPEGVFQRADGCGHVGQQGNLATAAAEIRVQRLDHLVAMLEQHVDAATQAILARRGANAALGEVIGALDIKRVEQRGCGVRSGGGRLGCIHGGSPRLLSFIGLVMR